MSEIRELVFLSREEETDKQWRRQVQTEFAKKMMRAEGFDFYYYVIKNSNVSTHLFIGKGTWGPQRKIGNFKTLEDAIKKANDLNFKEWKSQKKYLDSWLK